MTLETNFSRFWLHKTFPHTTTHCRCCSTLNNRVISFAEIGQTFKSFLRIRRYVQCERSEIFDSVLCQSLWRILWTCCTFSYLRSVKGRSSPSKSSTEAPSVCPEEITQQSVFSPWHSHRNLVFKHFIIFRRISPRMDKNLPQTPCCFKFIIRKLRFAINT